MQTAIMWYTFMAKSILCSYAAQMQHAHMQERSVQHTCSEYICIVHILCIYAPCTHAALTAKCMQHVCCIYIMYIYKIVATHTSIGLPLAMVSSIFLGLSTSFPALSAGSMVLLPPSLSPSLNLEMRFVLPKDSGLI